MKRKNDEGGGAAKSSACDSAPITKDGDMPKKKFYRARAHCNPLSFNEAFEYPVSPELMDWTEEHYPEHPALKKDDADGGEGDNSSVFPCASNSVQPDVLDVGCGFGGLTLALATALPHSTIMGLEIRQKVIETTHGSRTNNPYSFVASLNP